MYHSLKGIRGGRGACCAYRSWNVRRGRLGGGGGGCGCRCASASASACCIAYRTARDRNGRVSHTDEVALEGLRAAELWVRRACCALRCLWARYSTALRFDAVEKLASWLASRAVEPELGVLRKSEGEICPCCVSGFICLPWLAGPGEEYSSSWLVISCSSITCCSWLIFSILVV
jgi:hypothetical protein